MLRGNIIYPFPRWSKRIRGGLVWVVGIADTHTHVVWRFERAARYKWWSSIAPSWCFFDEWMEQGKLQGNYNN